MIALIDFYADWCGPCKIMKPIFEEVKKEYEGKIDFQKVDVEADAEKASKFGIMSIPTLVIMKDDQEMGRKMGAMPKDALIAWLDSYLS
jgi:thioredoxin 1